MFSGITSSLLCEQPHSKKGTSETVGTHQYVANRLIEDRVSHSFLEAGKKRFELVTVIDGHGGFQVAEYLTRELPNFISHELGKISPPNQSMADALRSAFLLADDRWFSLVEPAYKLGFTAPIKAGACAIAVLLNESEIVVASVGDCKCILATNGSVKDLNIERNANRDEEQARLRQQHPGEPDVVKCRKSWTDPLVPSKIFFSGCYVKGRLQPTKSFGDFHLKISSVLTDPERGSPFLDPSSKRTHPYIDADPDITVTLRDSGDYFLIAATDGLWDQFSSEEAAKIVESAFKSGLSPQQASETLVEAALLNAAKTRNIPLSDLKALPQGSARRNVHDDISFFRMVSLHEAVTFALKSSHDLLHQHVFLKQSGFLCCWSFDDYMADGGHHALKASQAFAHAAGIATDEDMKSIASRAAQHSSTAQQLGAIASRA